MTNTENLSYKTNNTIQIQIEGAAVDEVETDNIVQFPQKLEFFIEQNSGTAPSPILGQHLTFQYREENEFASEIYM